LPSTSCARLLRVAADMEKESWEYLSRRNLVIEVLPAHDGAVMMMILLDAGDSKEISNEKLKIKN